MLYKTSITKKGQMTLPKDLREALGIYIPAKLFIHFDKKKKGIRIEKTASLLSLAGIIKTKRTIKAAGLRKWVEHAYERT